MALTCGCLGKWFAYRPARKKREESRPPFCPPNSWGVKFHFRNKRAFPGQKIEGFHWEGIALVPGAGRVTMGYPMSGGSCSFPWGNLITGGAGLFSRHTNYSPIRTAHHMTALDLNKFPFCCWQLPESPSFLVLTREQNTSHIFLQKLLSQFVV